MRKFIVVLATLSTLAASPAPASADAGIEADCVLTEHYGSHVYWWVPLQDYRTHINWHRYYAGGACSQQHTHASPHSH